MNITNIVHERQSMIEQKGTGRIVKVDLGDLIDAIGALELRITDLEIYADEWESAGNPERAQGRREHAERLRGVIERFRKAIRGGA